MCVAACRPAVAADAVPVCWFRVNMWCARVLFERRYHSNVRWE